MAFNFGRPEEVNAEAVNVEEKPQKSVDEIVDELIEVLKQSELYQEYVRQQDAVRNIPDVVDKINEYRRLNLKIQTAENSDIAFDELEQLSNRIDELLDDKRVYSFVKTETKFIDKYQKIYGRIMEQIQFLG